MGTFFGAFFRAFFRAFLGGVVALGLVAGAPPIARAQPEAPEGAPTALGRFVAAGPGPTGLSLLSALGYGYTGAVLGMDDRHDRFSGRLALDGRLLPWLGVDVRLDGRYDRHSLPGQPSDDGLVGDPRIFVRADRLLGRGFAGGVRAGLWLPSGDAPSLQLDALTPELVAALRYAASAVPLSLGVNVGYRLDRSARTAGDAPVLSPSDRLALGVSAFDQVLLAVGATLGRQAVQGFAEASWDLLVGRGHPPALSSPIMFGAGVRAVLRPDLSVEAELEVSPSARPDLGAGAPLVVVPPRAAVWLGLVHRFGALAPSASRAPTAPTPAPVAATPPQAPPAADKPNASAVAAPAPAPPANGPAEGALGSVAAATDGQRAG